jgi:hypothetical protein
VSEQTSTTGRALRWVAAIVGGGVFIALGDHLFHVRTGVLLHLWYPQWDDQTLLVYPIFVVAAGAMLATASVVVRRVPRPSRLPSAKDLLLAGAAFFGAYALTGRIGTEHPWWTFGILAVLFAVRVAPDPDRVAVLVVGTLIGLGGCAGEAAVSELGLFTYVRSDVAGIPLWLFPLYLHGAFAVVEIVRLLDPTAGPAEPADRSDAGPDAEADTLGPTEGSDAVPGAADPSPAEDPERADGPERADDPAAAS